uniref:WD40 repeat domain-containing protein n=1 Tax=Petrachloros mirabilis TaxID=2918835 RepID=UPI003084203A
MNRNSRPAFDRVWQQQLSDYVGAIAWSPRDPILAAASATGEVILYPINGQPQVLNPPSGQPMDCIAFSQDGNFLAAGGQDGRLRLWHLPTTGDIPAVPTHSLPAHNWVEHLAWNPQHNWLAFNLGRYIQIWDATQQDLIATLDFEASSVLCLTWHPDGQRLMAGGYQGAKLWDSRAWQDDPYVAELANVSVALAWSADGQYLASGNMDRTITVLEWHNREPSPYPWVMQGFPGKIRHLAWGRPSSTGQAPPLASASVEGIVVWQRSADPNVGWDGRLLEGHLAWVHGIAFQPRTQLLASAAEDGMVGLWPHAQRLSAVLQGAPAGFSCLAWHPSGGYLAAGGQQGELLLWSQRSI